MVFSGEYRFECISQIFYFDWSEGAGFPWSRSLNHWRISFLAGSITSRCPLPLYQEIFIVFPLARARGKRARVSSGWTRLSAVPCTTKMDALDFLFPGIFCSRARAKSGLHSALTNDPFISREARKTRVTDPSPASSTSFFPLRWTRSIQPCRRRDNPALVCKCAEHLKFSARAWHRERLPLRLGASVPEHKLAALRQQTAPHAHPQIAPAVGWKWPRYCQG